MAQAGAKSIWDRWPTKTCWACGESVRRRVNVDCCPHCHVRLISTRIGRGKKKRTIYIAETPETTGLVKQAEQYIQEYGGMPEFYFLDFYLQLAHAKTLLAICDWSNELAFMVLKTFCVPEFRKAARLRRRSCPKSLTAVIYQGEGSQLSAALGFAKTLVDFKKRPTPPSTPPELEQKAMAI
jgi:hypothetical protein